MAVFPAVLKVSAMNFFGARQMAFQHRRSFANCTNQVLNSNHKLSSHQSFILRSCFHTSSSLGSYIGRMPIQLPGKVTIEKTSAANRRENDRLKVSGPLGILFVPLWPALNFTINDQQAQFSLVENAKKEDRQMFGTTRSLLNNAVIGVTEGYLKIIRLQGIGYRATLETRDDGATFINLKLGFSHPVQVEVPGNVKVSIPTPTRIVCEGIDKKDVSQFAAKIREFRKPEPYKGKGIYVGDETIQLKERKKSR